MEEEPPSRRSVAELAGRFKDSNPPPQKNEADKPVRRRPPRTLQLPKAHGDESEAPAGVTSPQPPKAKRNSALIEKLQANLALSPTGGPPLKSPGLRVLPLAFTPPSPGSAPGTVATASSSGTPTSPASPLTEAPASFEAPPSAAEGNILTSINKSRARVSIRRRPPSRRNRKSSSGDDVGGDELAVSSDTKPSSPTEDVAPGGGATDGGGATEEGGANVEEGGGEVFQKESETEASTLPEKNEVDEEETSSSDVKQEEEGDTSSSCVKEEQTPADEQKRDSAEGGVKDGDDEKNESSS